jgi:hypothetical protein
MATSLQNIIDGLRRIVLFFKQLNVVPNQEEFRSTGNPSGWRPDWMIVPCASRSSELKPRMWGSSASCGSWNSYSLGSLQDRVLQLWWWRGYPIRIRPVQICFRGPRLRENHASDFGPGSTYCKDAQWNRRTSAWPAPGKARGARSSKSRLHTEQIAAGSARSRVW